jgi:hypothetical protein
MGDGKTIQSDPNCGASKALICQVTACLFILGFFVNH